MADVADGYYRVDMVINGDSFKLTDGQTVKLIGIEAPLSGETCSVQASNRLSSLIEWKTVYLEKDVSETDSNNRLLRYAYVDDMFINYKLVYDGYAYADISYPNIKYAPELTDAEEISRQHDRGCLWYSSCSDCDDDYDMFVSCFINTAAYDSPIDPHVESPKVIARAVLPPFIVFGWTALKLGLISAIVLWLLFLVGFIGMDRPRRRKKNK